jgi:hypothetical protein
MAAPIDLEVYKDALLVLAMAGVVVPVMHRFRISPVLGLLIAEPSSVLRAWCACADSARYPVGDGHQSGTVMRWPN